MILDKMLHEQYENEFELLFYNLKDKIKDFNSNINQEQFETLIENNIFTNYLNLVIDSTWNLIENGCDTTSSFAGKGKTKPLKIMKSHYEVCFHH